MISYCAVNRRTARYNSVSCVTLHTFTVRYVTTMDNAEGTRHRCATCHILLPLSDFAFRTAAKRYKTCIPCRHALSIRAAQNTAERAPDPSPTERYNCTACKRWKDISQFPLNPRGKPYKTCVACRDKRSNRPVLGDVTGNSRRLRSRSLTAEPAPPPKRRRAYTSLPILTSPYFANTY